MLFRSEAKRRALDEIAARQRTADEKRKEEGQQKQVGEVAEVLSSPQTHVIQ